LLYASHAASSIPSLVDAQGLRQASISSTTDPSFVPILLHLRTPVLVAVGAAHVVSLPVVAFPTADYLLYGSVDFFLGTTMGLVAVMGMVVGARIAHAAPAATLRRVVATALLCRELLIAAQTEGGAPLARAEPQGSRRAERVAGRKARICRRR
jgi:uncharacterized membrane protein YfcA